MPARDNTGPAGQGPMTGRGAGICVTNNTNNGAGFGLGRGRGRGMGRGQGFGFRAAAPTREQQINELKAQISVLEAE